MPVAECCGLFACGRSKIQTKPSIILDAAEQNKAKIKKKHFSTNIKHS
jgi:hypothetical protein